MQLTSSAFQHEDKIPPKYTCDGEDINPSLLITDVPEGAKSLVLIMDDPDVPKRLRADGMWDHWVVFNLSPSTSKVNEDEQPQGVAGKGTEGKLIYRGPAPPDREHRYFFKLYALDTMLTLKEGATKAEVEDSMKSHILSEAVLMGRYERKS